MIRTLQYADDQGFGPDRTLGDRRSVGPAFYDKIAGQKKMPKPPKKSLTVGATSLIFPPV
jgi:hypothetical protein